MGFFKKVFRPVRKIAKKIIPKEIRPFLPYAAAMIPGAQGLASLNKFMTPVFQKALLAGATSAATDEQGNPLRAAALAAAPDVLAKGLGSAGRTLGNVQPDSKFAQFLTSKGTGLEATLANPNFTDSLKIAGAQTAIDQSAKFAEIRQDEIDQYNKNLLEQGVASKVDRRKAIFGIYKNAGYDDDYVNTMLDTYGYADGGRIGFANGGYRGKAEAAMGLMTMKDLLKGKTKAPIIEIEEDEEVVLGEDDDDDDRPIIKREPKYAEAMKDAMAGVEAAFGIPFGGVAPAEFKRFAQGGDVGEYKDIPNIFNHSDDGGIMNQISESMERDYDYFTRIKIRENLKQGETMEDAADLAEQEAMDIVMNKYTKGGFARGGEVEIEEETEDLGIRDLMRDQGIEYGEQVSNAQNDELLEKLFEEFLDLGFSPEDAAKKAREAFDNMSQGQGIKGTQVASGYKDDIEEMYEQYVFEMEEQGLQPMDFASYLRQAQSGMASGGRVGFTKGGDVMRGVNRGIDPLEVLDILREFKRIKKKYDYEMSFDDYLDGEMFAKGGRVNYAGGGASYNSSSRYSFLIDKYNKGIPLTPSEADELEMLEMTYADDSQGRAEGGIMNKNLLNTGMDKDMRGGGFIPEGTKEKADDVPARLSKNEFVMTADAVRAAGGGSVNEGAKRMYETMHKLEAKV